VAYEAERRVILSHQALVSRVRSRVIQYVKDTWRGLGSWRGADIDRFVGLIVPVVLSGQKQIGQLTNGYLDAMARLAGFTASPAIVPRTGAALRGVDPTEVYRRPGRVIWNAISEGKPFAVALGLGSARLDQLLGMDMQLAQTSAAFDKISGDSRVVGYQRVLNSAAPCELCQLASTQRYWREDLMPIHDHCSCSVAPLYGDRDPGQVINRDLLDQLNESSRATASIDDVAIRDHGEYGPVLTWKDQAFRGPEEVAAIIGWNPGDPTTPH
jgi:hypothetical protein